MAKIPLVKGETDDATAMSYGYIPGVARYSPFEGAAYAVVESLSKLAAVGADPLKARLTFQEYFERLHDVPTRWGKPAAALLGALEAQLGMGLPSIGGKDSMSGSFEQLDVPPTLVSFAVTMTKASKTIFACAKKPGSHFALLPIPEDENGMPNWEALKAYYRAVLLHIECGDIISASVVREGGAAAAVLRMCFGSKTGFRFAEGLSKETLYAPQEGALVVELSSEADLSTDAALSPVILGRTSSKEDVKLGGERISLEELCAAWMGTLGEDFPQQRPSRARLQGRAPVGRSGRTRPRPSRWPGPGCSSPPSPAPTARCDSARAFEKAGAQCEILVVKNLSVSDIEETIDRMEKAIRRAQIVMLPGGFSGGDEPEGSRQVHRHHLPQPPDRPGCHRLAGSPGRPDAGHLQRLPGLDQAGPGALRQNHRAQGGRPHLDLQHLGPPRQPHGVHPRHQREVPLDGRA